MTLRTLVLLASLISLPLSMAAPAFAQRDDGKVAKKPLVTYRDWSVYTHKTPNDLMCFAVTSPKDMIPKEVKRAEVLFYVTRWKSNPKKAQVSVLIGYPFKDGSKPDVKIKAQEFKFFVKDDKAWIRDEGDEKLLLSAMRRGARMKMTGISAQNVMTKDQYSLSGVSKALNKIKRLCR